MNGRSDRPSAFKRSETRQRGAHLLVACFAFGGIVPDVGARTIDLVSHNGFDQCWSTALTANQFLQLLVAATAGSEVCIPPADDGSSCSGSVCANGAPGCSVTLRGGQYTPAHMEPTLGYARFDGATGFDPFSMPVVVPLVGACTLNFIDTTGVLIHQSLNYSLRPDGNSGYYTFNGSDVNTAVTGLTANSTSLTGGFGCQFASLSLSFYIAMLSDQLGSAIAAALIAVTDGQSLCPLP